MARRAAAEAVTSVFMVSALETRARRGRPREPLRRGRDAAPAGPGADGARRHPDRPRGARGDARGVRRDSPDSRPDLRARRARVQHRLSPPARRRSSSTSSSFRRRSARGRAARRMHRSSRSCASGTRSSISSSSTAKVEAEVDVRRRAADAGGWRGPAAHDLPAGDRRDRAALEHRSEPPEHPDPHRARPPHPARVRGPEGKLLLGADYSQQELRILAHVSGDPGLKADFEAHSDIHLAAAARVLHLEADQVGPKERSVAKMINYGIAYGLSDFGLADRLQDPARGGAATSRTTTPPTRASAATRPR